MGTKDEVLFGAPKRRAFASTLLVLVVAILVTAGAPLYLPFIQSDSIGVPILLFPVTWFLLFYFSAMAKSIGLVYAVLLVLGIGHFYLIANSLGML